MKLLPKSIWIFASIMALLLITAIFPSPAIIGISILMGSLAIVWQAVLILKDEN
jgi:hypothetical protein